MSAAPPEIKTLNVEVPAVVEALVRTLSKHAIDRPTAAAES